MIFLSFLIVVEIDCEDAAEVLNNVSLATLSTVVQLLEIGLKFIISLIM